MKAPNPPRPKPCDDDGGPAFPSSSVGIDERNQGWTGGALSKRDYFAAAAISGLCANSTNSEVRGLAHFPTFAAGWAYRMADALLDERAKGRQT